MWGYIRDMKNELRGISAITDSHEQKTAAIKLYRNKLIPLMTSNIIDLITQKFESESIDTQNFIEGYQIE